MIILIILPIDRNWLSYYGRWWYDGRLSQTIKGADNQVSGTKRGIGKQDVQRAGTKQMLSAADIFWKNAAFHVSIFQDMWISWDATDRILLGWRNWFDIYAWASGVCKKYDKGRCRLLAHVGKIFERPGIYFKKSNLIFQKRPGKAQSASPWRNILPGLVFLCVFIKGWGLNEKETMEEVKSVRFWSCDAVVR